MEILVCLLLGSHKPFPSLQNNKLLSHQGPALLLSQNMFRRGHTS
ncbi:hypothetical protein C3B79_2438 [Aeromonas hydrophila]|nr:hypothetical protein C3B79_2438 [Aeromonas hydrophila]